MQGAVIFFSLSLILIFNFYKYLCSKLVNNHLI